MIALRLLLWPMARPACADCLMDHRRPCDSITHLGVNFLNENLPVPAAFQNTIGTIGVGYAEFAIYALTDDPWSFSNITDYASRSGGRQLRAHVRAAPGRHGVSGAIRFYDESNT